MIKSFINLITIKIKRSINIKLCLWIAFSLIISISLGIISVCVLKTINFVNVEHVDYDRDRYDTEEDVLNFINDLYLKDNDYDDYINKNISSFKGNVFICDKDGKVKYGNINDGYAHIDSIELEVFREEIQKNKKSEYKIMYPLTIENNIYYFIMIKELDGISIYTYEVSYVIAVVLASLLFIYLIYFGIRKKVKYIEYISSSINEISKGNLNYNIDKIGQDELSIVADQINIMEGNLLNMIERERKADKSQRELITNISHDLKTPLTVILGYLDIIRSKSYKTEEDEVQYLDAVYKKALVLQKMILDLFELVKLGNGQESLNKSDVNINKVLKQLIMENLPMAEDKNISMEFSDAQGVINLNIDLDKICRVFNNLMNNALKYTPENGEINVELKEDDAGALISFSNTCENIKKEDLDNIFNRFYRGDKARNSRIEGSGVGLSIVKKIIELHNSSIWAELHEGKIFFFIRLRG